MEDLDCANWPGAGDGICSTQQQDTGDDDVGDACDNCVEGAKGCPVAIWQSSIGREPDRDVMLP